MDEISETNKIALAHKLQVTADTYKNIRFIIAGRDGGFSSEITTALKNTKTLLLIPYNDTSDIKLSNLLKTYDDSPLSDLLFIPLFRTYFIQNQNKKINSFEEFYKLFIVNQLEKDKSTFDEAEKIPKRANAKSKINCEHIAKKNATVNFGTSYRASLTGQVLLDKLNCKTCLFICPLARTEFIKPRKLIFARLMNL